MTKTVVELFYSDYNEEPFNSEWLWKITDNLTANGIEHYFTEDRIHMKHERISMLISACVYIGGQFAFRQHERDKR